MKIAVIGAGAVGSIFSAQLAKSGADVTLIDRYADRAAHIQSRGMTAQGVRGEYTAPVKATADSAAFGQADLILVCVKAYDTADAIAQHRSLIGPETMVLTLQNGLGNVDALVESAGREKVLAGTTAQGGYLVGQGIVHHAGAGPTHIGELSGQITPRIKAVAELFEKAGIPTEISGDVDALIWTKLVVNVGINPLTGLLYIRNGQTVELEPAHQLQKLAVKEALAVAEKAGIAFDPKAVTEAVEAVAKATAGNVNSMLSDIRKQRRTEIDFINGAICKQGEKLGIPTPINQALTLLVKATEAAYGATVVD